MYISIEKKKFSEAVHTVSRFAEKGTATLPALSSILILSGDDGIKLRATNLETAIDLKLPGSQKGEGVVAIPARILEQIAGSLTGEGSVSLDHKGDTVTITSGTGRSIVRTVPYEDFPVVPMPESPKNRIVLGGALLRSLFSTIATCASTSTVRPELASIYLSIEGGVLTAAATDSFRLVEKKVPLSGKASQGKVLIPAKNALDVSSALPDEDVIVSYDDHQCIFVFEGGILSTRLASAVYPDYRQIIPKDVAAEATVLRKDFETALKRAIIFSDTFQKIKMSFDPKAKALSIFAKNTDVGESTEPIPGQLSGNGIELSFNHRYLQAFFPFSTSESITITASGIGRPLTIRGTGDTTLMYLVMPMNQ